MSKKCIVTAANEECCSLKGCQECQCYIELGEFETIEEFMRNELYVKAREKADSQWAAFNEEGQGKVGPGEPMVIFIHDGYTIINPFLDEAANKSVDPIEYYGKAFEEAWAEYLPIVEPYEEDSSKEYSDGPEDLRDTEAVSKIIECLRYCRDQHRESGGEILHDITDDNFVDMIDIVRTMLED